MDLADIYRLFPNTEEHIQIDKCVKDRNLMLISIEAKRPLTKIQHPFHGKSARGNRTGGNIPQNITNSQPTSPLNGEKLESTLLKSGTKHC